jgi:hypothetical protein
LAPDAAQACWAEVAFIDLDNADPQRLMRPLMRRYSGAEHPE